MVLVKEKWSGEGSRKRVNGVGGCGGGEGENDERRGMVEERRKGEGEVEGMKAMEKIYIRSILGKAGKASEGE